MASTPQPPPNPRYSSAGRRAAVQAYGAPSYLFPISRGNSSVSPCLRYSQLAAVPAALGYGVLAYTALGSGRVGAILGTTAARLLRSRRFHIAAALASATWMNEVIVPSSGSCWPCYAAEMASRSSVGRAMRDAYRAAVERHGEPPDSFELQASLIVAGLPMGYGPDKVNSFASWACLISAWLHSTRSFAVLIVRGWGGVECGR